MARGYHHGDLKAALITSAMDLLDAGGPDAVTVRAVARQAGVAHSAPINHFHDRAALLSAVANLNFADLIAVIDEAFDAAESSIDKLLAFGPAVTRFALAHPNRYRLLWRRDSLDPDDRFIDDGISLMCERLKALLSADAVPTERDVDSEVIALWSMTHGYVALRLDGNLVAGDDAVSGKPRDAAIIEVLLVGLRRRGAAEYACPEICLDPIADVSSALAHLPSDPETAVNLTPHWFRGRTWRSFRKRVEEARAPFQTRGLLVAVKQTDINPG